MGGERRIRFQTQRGGERNLTFQVTAVNKVLASVTRMCSLGQQVVFNPPGHPDGSYIRDLKAEVVTPLREENGVYKLDAWVRPHSHGSALGFGRRDA